MGDVLGQLFALRGYGRVQAARDQQRWWQELVGQAVASQTRVIGLKNGVLHVGVFNSVLLAELVGYHKQDLMEKLRSAPQGGHIRDVKFKLQARPIGGAGSVPLNRKE